MIKRYCFKSLFITIILINGKLFGQSVSLDFNSLAGSNEQLPFWLWANQLGRYDRNDNAVQHLGASGDYRYRAYNSDFSFETGADVDFSVADKAKVNITQLFGTINWKSFALQIGAFADKEVYGGLSTSNGNFSVSRNARPHPAIRLGLNRYVYFTSWFAVYGFYQEGLLNDSRYVDNTHLHRKALYLRFGKPESLQFTAGMEHFVMWGGTHPEYGELQSWDTYFDYVLGHKGNENALMTDQLNVVGNSYGSYQIKMYKSWSKIKTTFYISHPYDDHSGMELENYNDNLIGVFIDFNKEYPFVKNVVAEYFHTKNQSGKYHLGEAPEGEKHRRGRDDYYNHGIYKSGVTYSKMAMCSPLFGPVNVTDGISVGFDNTRFAGFHFAANGFVSKKLQWKGMLTYSNNFGRYNNKAETSYVPSRKMLATMGQLKYKVKKVPLTVALSLAVDHGSLYDEGKSTTRIGGAFSICCKLFK